MLDDRALNRATLARQLLLDRSALGIEATLQHLLGMQAQLPYAPYVGLWTRLRAFDPAELGRLLTERMAVRMVVMRSTVHLMTAPDALYLRPLVQPALDRQLRANRPLRLDPEDLDLTEVLDEARRVLDASPCTPAQLGARLAQRWPDQDAAALTAAARTGLPLVQLPPRGVWGIGGQTRLATAERWLGAPLATNPSLEGMILRYLAAFGPASAADVQTWSGLTHLNEVVDRLRPELRHFRCADGSEVVDLADAPRPDPGVPAPPRFLPEYDNVLLSHADRSRMVSVEDRKRLALPNGMRSAVLIDGRVGGSWKVVQKGRTARLSIAAFRRVSAAESDALRQEGAGLLGLLAPAVEDHDVEVVLP